MSSPLVLQTRRRGGKTVIVANPIKRGYSKPTVSANIAELRRAGYPINQAVAIALKAGRASWRERYPKRKFPDHLAAPRRQSWVDEHGTKKKRRKKKR